MKYLGIDYGAKRVGIAISDDTGAIAFPRETIPNDERLLARAARLAEEEKIGTIVVGDTRAAGGRENPITAEADRFARDLKERTRLPVERIFEVWSSIEASRLTGDEGHDDAVAAAIILQRYLEMRGGAVQ